MKVQPGVFTSGHSNASDDGKNADSEAPSGRGLSELVRQCLGRPLDKRQQLSNWERRPLRQNQIVYAGKASLCSILCSYILAI